MCEKLPAYWRGLLSWHPVADHHAWVVDRHRRLARMDVPRYIGLHRLQLRSRSPGAYLCGIGYSPYVGGGKFSEVRKRG
jgi:hypothetical protein